MLHYLQSLDRIDLANIYPPVENTGDAFAATII